MSNLITLDKLNEWLEGLEETIKGQIVVTKLADEKGREQLYYLYQASQMFKAQVLAEFAEDVSYQHAMYDEE